MARRPGAAARPREGTHEARRRACAAATRAALGATGGGVPPRHGRRREASRRAVRRAIAAPRLPLHVRPDLRGRLPGQLVDRRLHRRRPSPPARPGCDVRPRLAGATGEAAGLQAPDGLECSLGLVRAQRLQLRPRLLVHGGEKPRDRSADGRRASADRRAERPRIGDRHRRVPHREPWVQRVRAGRREHLPHVLHELARIGVCNGLLPDPRPCTEGARRGRGVATRIRRHDEYVGK